MNHLKFPYQLPFKFVPLANTGMHFDDKLFCKQIRSFEIKAKYKQKWLKNTTTDLIIESSIAPNDLILLNNYGIEIKTFEWSILLNGTNYSIYKINFDVSDIAEGVYFLYQKVAGGLINWEVISEPIHIASSHEDVIRFVYKNSFNKDDVPWTLGISFTFICEADIQDFEPDFDTIDFVDEVHDRKILYGTPFRQFQLYVGNTKNGVSGVPPYMIDILSRVFTNDNVLIEEKKYVVKAGSKFKITRVRGYPLIGASLELWEGNNLQSLEFSDTTPLPDGFIAVYDIDTGLFGPGGLLNVIDVEQL